MEKNIDLQVGVKILLKDRKTGRYLLVKRSSEKYPDVGDLWDIVGGRIIPGSPLLENLKREVREETQLEIIGTPKLIAAQDILRVPGRHIVRLTYLGETEGEPVLNEENVAYQLFDLKELNSIKDLDIYFRELLEGGLFD